MSDWQSAALGDLSEVFNGKTPSKDEQRADGFPVLKIRDVDEFGRFRGKGKSFVDSSFAKKYAAKWLQSNDILILNAAHNAAYVASKTYYAGEAVAGFLPTGEWLIVRVKSKKVLPAFVDFWLKTPHTRESIRDLVKGIHLYPKDVATLKIPLPPLDEQRRIVGLLDRAAEIRRRADAARAKARAIIPALFLETFGDPATNPKGWPVVMIGEAGEVKLGRQRAPKYQSGKFTRPYVRVANVFENMIDVSDLLSMDFDERDYSNYRLSHGDILLNEGQSIELVGRPAMWRDEVEDCCFQNTLVRFRCDPAKIVPDFALAAFLRMYRDGHLSKIASKTSNVAHLGAGRFGKLPIVLPPIRLQTAFAEQAQRVDSLARHLDAAAAKAEAMAVGLSAEVIG